jgi:hypothetical protein
MPPSALTVNDTPIEVALCDWHLRKIFNTEGFCPKVSSGEMKIARRVLNERKKPSANGPSLEDAPYNEEFIIADASTNNEVVRCQWFLKGDKTTPAASGLPDPKEINWGGYNYHQTGKRNPQCAHCAAGISTY